MQKKAIVIGINSGIGTAISHALLQKNVQLLGSYRTIDNIGDELKSMSIVLDLKHKKDIDDFVESVKNEKYCWDYLLLCSGTMVPIGAFEDIDIDAWAECINVNLLHQMRLLQQLLPLRNRHGASKPVVLSLAGGGVNGAPENYSAYTLAKIGLIKMTELLATEIPNVRFVNLGPGWVDTAIHKETLAAADLAGPAFEQTQKRVLNNEFVPIQKVVESALALLEADTAAYSGRNFSAANDQIRSKNLVQALQENPNMYKLRRQNNEWSE